MNTPENEALFERWYWVQNLGYRIKVSTNDTYWWTVHQPAKEPEEGDVRLEKLIQFLEILEQAGIYQIEWSDHIAAFLTDNRIGRWLNSVIPNKAFHNEGMLLHPNRLR